MKAKKMLKAVEATIEVDIEEEEQKLQM